MGILNRKQHFCTICKKSISYRQKPKRRWNIEGFLCGDCFVDEMKKQSEIEEEIKRQNYDKNNEGLPNSQKVSAWNKLFNSLSWAIFQIIIGLYLLVGGSEWYHNVIGFIGLVSGGYSLYKYSKIKRQMTSISENNAINILKERYAKGEITKEEFDKIKDDLKD